MILHRIRRVEGGKAEGVPQRTLSVALMLALACITAVGCSKSDVITSSGSNSAESEAPATVQEEPNGVYVLKSVTPLMESGGFLSEKSIVFDLDEKGNRTHATVTDRRSLDSTTMDYELDSNGNIQAITSSDGYSDTRVTWNNELNQDGLVLTGNLELGSDSLFVEKKYNNQKLTSCSFSENGTEYEAISYSEDGLIEGFFDKDLRNAYLKYSYSNFNERGKPESCSIAYDEKVGYEGLFAEFTLEYDDSGCLSTVYIDSVGASDSGSGSAAHNRGKTAAYQFEYEFVGNPSLAARASAGHMVAFEPWKSMGELYAYGCL